MVWRATRELRPEFQGSTINEAQQKKLWDSLYTKLFSEGKHLKEEVGRLKKKYEGVSI